MDDIADRAGVSKPVLYQHFPGKLELYLALVDQHCDDLEQLVRDALGVTRTTRSGSTRRSTAYFDFVSRDGAAFRLIFESDLDQRVGGAQAARPGRPRRAPRRSPTSSAEDTDDARVRGRRSLGVALVGLAQPRRPALARRRAATITQDEAIRISARPHPARLGDFPEVGGEGCRPRSDHPERKRPAPAVCRVPPHRRKATHVEVRIGVQHVAREITFETEASAQDVAKAVSRRSEERLRP